MHDHFFVVKVTEKRGEVGYIGIDQASGGYPYMAGSSPIYGKKWDSPDEAEYYIKSLVKNYAKVSIEKVTFTCSLVKDMSYVNTKYDEGKADAIAKKPTADPYDKDYMTGYLENFSI